jgi:DNA polymerase/3'-5' exonuclease PolX
MNQQIIEQFELLIKKNQSDINLAIEEKDTKRKTQEEFRMKSNKRVLGILKKYPKEITKKNYQELKELGGIGKGTIEKIEQILEKGYLEETKDLKEDKKEIEKERIIEELEKIINIGKSKAIELYQEGVKSVEDLKNKIKNNKIQVNDKIMLGLKYHGVYQENIPRNEIMEIEKFLLDKIKKLNKDEELNKNKEYLLTICGSYRRKKSTSNDIDILISKRDTTEKSKEIDSHLPKLITLLKKKWKHNDGKPLLIDDLTDNSTTKYMGFLKWQDNPPRRVDIRFISYDSYYTALLYFTGSGEFNKVMRNIAITKGYKLSEYGLFENETNKKIKISSEKEVFEILGMDYLEPELR